MNTLLDSSEIKEAASLFSDLLTQGSEPAAPEPLPQTSPIPGPVSAVEPPPKQVPSSAADMESKQQQILSQVREQEMQREYQSRVELMSQSPSLKAVEDRAAAYPTGGSYNSQPASQAGYRYETMFDKMTQSPGLQSIEDRAAALPTNGFSAVSAAGLSAGITHDTGSEPQQYSEYEVIADRMAESPVVQSIEAKAAALNSDGFSAIPAPGLAAGTAHKAEPGSQRYSEYEAMADKMTQSPSVESIEDKAAALPTEDHQEKDPLGKTLSEMCRKGPFAGALLADTNGAPLSVCNQPMDIDQDILAGFSAAMGESLARAARLLKLPNADNIYIDIDKKDKFALTKFVVKHRLYFLVVICPRHTDEKEAVGWGIEKLKDLL